MKKLRKFLFRTLLIVILVLSGVFGVFAWRGYRQYQNALLKQPLVSLVREIRADEQYTKLEKIDPMFLKAIVATEDRRFYRRDTLIDYWAIMRATVTNLRFMQLVEGGSTIPMQLAKNLYFDFDPTLTQKFAEFFMVRTLSENYSKDEVLELYVNTINYGDNHIGIYAASTGYFGVLPDALNDAQATLLAGLPQAPAYYQLSDHFANAKKRQEEVLAALVRENELSQSEASDILAQEVITK